MIDIRLFSRLLFALLIVAPLSFFYGCTTTDPPKKASQEEVNKMLQESSGIVLFDPSIVEELLVKIAQTSNLKDKQLFAKQYHHAALHLPPSERDLALKRLQEVLKK